jgi:predicted phage replisome organizer
MSDNAKYYYLKLKENFFDTEEMKILESQKNGVEYQNLYLKCCLLALKSGGRLIFKEYIPYDVDMLSTVLRVSIDTVKTGLELFQKLGLIEIMESGDIFMSDIQSLIGKGSTEAERKKIYRERIEKSRTTTIGGTMSGQSLPELEIELKKELEIDKEMLLPAEALALAKTLNDLHLSNIDQKAKRADAKTLFRWAEDISKLNRIDGRTWDEIEDVIRWVKTPGQFWAPNIMSGKKLREKFDTIMAQMKRGGPVKAKERPGLEMREG